jgi:hypothetical protein
MRARRAGIHDDKGAGAVGALGIAGGETGLAEQRRLLVAGDAGDRNAVGQPRTPRVWPSTPLLGRSGQDLSGHLEQRSSSRPRPGSRFISEVRAALETSVTCTSPPVSATAGSCRSCRRPAPRAFSARRGGHFLQQPAELAGAEVGIEHQPLRSAPAPRARLASARRQKSAVRRHCQTIALCTASPLRRSHSTAVSRWLVMPIAAISEGLHSLRAAGAQGLLTEAQIASASCSTQPGFGKCWGTRR